MRAEIQLDVFLNAKHISLSSPDFNMSIFKDKASELQSAYKCFFEIPAHIGNGNSGNNAKFNSMHQPRWKRAPRRETVSLAQRPQIGGAATSKDVQVKREFTSLINKLTYANRDNIFKEIKKVLNAEYISVYVPVLWDMMQRMVDLHKLYIDVFMMLECNDECVNLWSMYVNNKQWLPPSDCSSVEEQATQDYDEFCDFMKWKKRAIASISALSALESCGILNNNLDVLFTLTGLVLNDADTLLEQCPTSTHDIQIANALMEQIFMIHKCAKSCKRSDVLAKISAFAEKYKIKSGLIAAMVRFKILDLYDVCTKK